MTELVVEEINTTVVVEEQSTQVFVSPPENAIDIFEESVEVTVLDNDAQVVIYQGALVGGSGSNVDMVQVRWLEPGLEVGNVIEIAGKILDFNGNFLASSVVDIEVMVTDGAIDGEPSESAYLTQADSPVGIVLAGTGTASLVIRSNSGNLKVAVHETQTAHRFLWLKAAGHERVWVRAADGVQELVFS